mmetsp:Transcript_99732/g.277754  ORF Transcript_99732/g.277754 Transcript_99732/m.277754 type:complete len:97 (+) Transcript_99732:938-1228(+)
MDAHRLSLAGRHRPRLMVSAATATWPRRKSDGPSAHGSAAIHQFIIKSAFSLSLGRERERGRETEAGTQGSRPLFVPEHSPIGQRHSCMRDPNVGN